LNIWLGTQPSALLGASREHDIDFPQTRQRVFPDHPDVPAGDKADFDTQKRWRP